MLFGWGLTLLLPGDSLAAFPAYTMVGARFDEATWAIVLIAISLVRIVALLVDRSVPRVGPGLRCATSIAGAIVWSQLLASFLDYSLKAGAASPGLSVYLVLVGADMFSAGRAAWDVAARWR